jgi:hypothetical protein
MQGNTATGVASLILNYAENERRKRRAGILRSEYKPEGPHNTAAVLSAKEVYHIWKKNAHPTVIPQPELRTQLSRSKLSKFGEIEAFNSFAMLWKERIRLCGSSKPVGRDASSEVGRGAVRRTGHQRRVAVRGRDPGKIGPPQRRDRQRSGASKTLVVFSSGFAASGSGAKTRDIRL